MTLKKEIIRNLLQRVNMAAVSNERVFASPFLSKLQRGAKMKDDNYWKHEKIDEFGLSVTFDAELFIHSIANGEGWNVGRWNIIQKESDPMPMNIIATSQSGGETYIQTAHQGLIELKTVCRDWWIVYANKDRMIERGFLVDGHPIGVFRRWSLDSNLITREHYDRQGRLHGIQEYWDGDYRKEARWEGVKVPLKHWENPADIPSEYILQHGNSEVKAALIKMKGMDEFFRGLEHKIIDVGVDPSGNPMSLLEADINNGIKARYLEVECTTTKKHTFLGVPPNIGDVQEALSWTFYKKVGEYSPATET